MPPASAETPKETILKSESAADKEAGKPAVAETGTTEPPATVEAAGKKPEEQKHRRRRRGRRRRSGERTGVTAPAAEKGAKPPADRGPEYLRGKKVLLLNAAERGEVRVAVVEDGELKEVFVERESSAGQAGNIYKGKVVGIEPSLQAAFVDLGSGRNGFLHVSDCLSPGEKTTASDGERENGEGNGKGNGEGEKHPRHRSSRRGGREHRRIESLLRSGHEVLVQVVKEGLGQKGPGLTMYLALPGRYMVLMPGNSRLGVSKRIGDDEKRRELRRILSEIRPPNGMGVIVRTAGVDRSPDELQRDMQELVKLYEAILERSRAVPVGALIYREAGVAVRVLRDILTEDVTEIIVDHRETAETAKKFVAAAAPWAVKRLRLVENGTPLFETYGVEEQLRRLFHRKVPLANGGSIIIEQTEALTTIDVNTGRCRSRGNPAETILKTNLEAAREVARQLRLRDIGGQIVIDFIDMDVAEHRRQVEREFQRYLEPDKARLHVLPVSALGIVEMTRQRVRLSLRKTLFDRCPTCCGAGQVKSGETLGFEVLRELRRLCLRGKKEGRSNTEGGNAETKSDGPRFRVTLHPVDACAILNRFRRELTELEEATGANVEFVPDEGAGRGILRIESAREKGGWGCDYVGEVDEYVRNS